MSTLFALFYVAILLLLLPSTLVLFNLLQPEQAQSNFSFRTTEPAGCTVSTETCLPNIPVGLTFDAKGTASSSSSSSGSQDVNITGGTFN
jgi:hypothetical protein